MFCRMGLIVFLLLGTGVVSAIGHESTPRQVASIPMAGRVLELPVYGAALKGNLLGDSLERHVTVYLPPSYDREPQRRYPVIYSLGGFTPLPSVAGQAEFGPRQMLMAPIDRAIVSGRLGDLILVQVEGHSRLGGSFWVNSAASGRWEDFLTRDVIGTVDARLRTIPARASRGLYGGSMGGFGAISIAMHRPKLFGTVFAQSPCCLAMIDELGPSPAWTALLGLTLQQAYAAFQQGDPRALQAEALAAAFAPDAARPPFFGDLPYRMKNGVVVADAPVLARWTAKLPPARLDKEAAGLKTLHGFRIQYGDQDELRHIVVSLPAFHEALIAHGVAHEFHVDHGGHMGRTRFADDAVPFFARTLAGATGRSPRP